MVVTPMATTGAVVAHTDVTEREQIEDALRENERRFPATFEQAAVRIDHTSSDGRWLRLDPEST
jgi:hypothetical protein